MKENSFTIKEIFQQPTLWNKVYDLILSQEKLVKDFINFIYESDTDVIFTGAGSSFFIGEMVAPFFQKDSGISARAVSTTEIVTNPLHYINSKKETLLISFARSGNSPESVAAVNIANQVSDKVKHLIITCNSGGELAKFLSRKDTYVILLPEESNDKSLAMTSSFTSMALSAILIGRISKLNKERDKLFIATEAVAELFANQASFIDSLTSVNCERAIFLGSGAFTGTVREAHLKLQELTDGQIISKFDSFLGFRHGPKAVVNDKTLIVYIFSNDEYLRKYEYDLVNQIKNSQNPLLTIGICNTSIDDRIKSNLDELIEINSGIEVLDEAYWALASLATVQLFATYKSIQLGFNPDSPSTSGSIHRVVQGVTIYNFEEINMLEVNY